MSIFIKEIVKNKLKNLTTKELMQYSKQYDFHITEQQARKITNYLQSHSPDPFDSQKRKEMLVELAAITDRETAMKAQNLFEKMIHSYGLQDLFK